MRHLAAVLLAVPTSVLILLGITFQISAWSGKDASDTIAGLIGVAALLAAAMFALHRTTTPAGVVRRGCRLGMLASVLLPVLVSCGMLTWTDSASGMGGLTLYVILIMAFVTGALSFAGFFLGSRLAAQQ